MKASTSPKMLGCASAVGALTGGNSSKRRGIRLRCITCPRTSCTTCGRTPGEQNNLINERPEIAAQLLAEMREFVDQRLCETGLPDPTEEQEITLRRIGRLETAVPRDQIL